MQKDLSVYGRLQLQDSGTVDALLEEILTSNGRRFRRNCWKKRPNNAKAVPNWAKKPEISPRYRAYNELLLQKYDDPEEDFERLYAVLQTHRFFEDRLVYVDSTAAFADRN